MFEKFPDGEAVGCSVIKGSEVAMVDELGNEKLKLVDEGREVRLAQVSTWLELRKPEANPSEEGDDRRVDRDGQVGGVIRQNHRMVQRA